MNRNRGIICIILGILVCGVLLTSFNSRMLKKQQEEMARDEVIREAAYGNEAAYGGEAGYGAVNSRMYVGSAAAREEEISPASAGEQETELQPGEEEESAPVPSDSGQDGAAAEGAEPAEAEEDLTGESPAQPSAEADGGKRFIGAIKCQGFSFADAEPEEKLQTIRGYITFFNVMMGPVQYRQSSRDVNLDSLIESYRKQITSLQEKRFTLNLDYTDLKAESENPALSPSDYDIYYEKLKHMQREMTSLAYQIEQLEAQVQYMYAISGENAGAKREEVYIFDWQYNPVDFSSQELEGIEVYQRAEAQLKAKANAYINALRNCGVHARRMSGVELLEEIRRYTHPVSAAKGTVEDIVQTAYDSICVTSRSLQKLEDEVNRKIVEEIARETGIAEGGFGR